MVNEFVFVLQHVMLFEDELKNLEGLEYKVAKKTFNLELETKILEYRMQGLGSDKPELLPIESESGERVLSHLLKLEKHSNKIYEFYAQSSNPVLFRCSSLYKSYRIDENEEFKKALEMFDQLRMVKKMNKKKENKVQQVLGSE